MIPQGYSKDCDLYRGHIIRRFYWDEGCTRPRLLYSAYVGYMLLTATTLKGIKNEIDATLKEAEL